MIGVLGGGISGISAAYHLSLKNKQTVIFEAKNSWGGLCDNFRLDDFLFDNCIHLSFSNDDYVNALFANSTGLIKHIPNPSNYYKGKWLKHPAQNNIYSLDINEKIEIIKGFIDREKEINVSEIADFETWLRKQYGNYFAENFPVKYGLKYWTIEAKSMTTEWIKDRMYQPSLDEVLFGSYTEETPLTYYAKEMRYPTKGGYKAFLSGMASACDIRLNHEVTHINTQNKYIEFKNGKKEQYESLISSLPLPVLINCLDVPLSVQTAAENLIASSVFIVSIGLNKLSPKKDLWFYIYDEDILAARVYSPSLKSSFNAPEYCSSFQFEIYSSKYKSINMSNDNLLNHIIETAVQKLHLFEKDDIKVTDVRFIPYGNVIFDQSYRKNRKIVHDWLDTCNIKYIGRFGEWDYLWSDQSLLSGKKCIDKHYSL